VYLVDTERNVRPVRGRQSNREMRGPGQWRFVSGVDVRHIVEGLLQY